MDVLMPQLGETVAEGTVTVWHKKIGDPVAASEILFEVETDKVAMEVPSLVSGILREILVGEGEQVDVGTRLAVIETADGVAAAPTPAVEPAPPPAPSAAAPAPPAPSRGGGGGKKLSPAVRKLVADHGIDPAAVPGTGRDGRIQRKDVIAYIEGRPAAGGAAGRGKLSPVVKRLLSDHGLDPARIPGTGRDGRIQRKDILAFIASAGSPAAPAAARGGADRTVIPLSRIRKRIGEHMVRSKATSPHVLQVVEADFSRVNRAREAVREAWRAREGFSLTYLPFIAKAVTLAIREFPHVNASIEGEDLIVYPRINLAIAVDMNFQGLIAPVVKDADLRGVSELARAIHRLATQARENRLTPDDLTEGTYSISNNGSFGTLFTAAIINQPQVAILSTDAIRKRPVVVEGAGGDSIAIRPVGYLAHSFDHRAIDGAYSAAFLGRLREIIEETEWQV